MITIERTMNRQALDQLEDLPVLLFEGERNAHKFVISPETEGQFTGYSVTARLARADRRDVAVEGSLDSAGNACVVLTPACYAAPGRFLLSVYAANDDETVCVYACRGMILPTLGHKGDAEGENPIIEAYTDPAIAEIRQQLAALQTAIDAIPVRAGAGEDTVVFGLNTAATGTQSTAIGKETVATKRSSFVIGEYNVIDPSDPVKRTGYVFIVGNGTAEAKRSNALALTFDGTLAVGGALTLGKGMPWEVQLTPQKLSQLLALLE